MYQSVSPEEYKAAVKNAMSNITKIGEMHQYPTMNIKSKFFKEVMSSMIFQALQKYHGHHNGDGASDAAQSNRDCQVAPENPNNEFTVLVRDGAVTYASKFFKEVTSSMIFQALQKYHGHHNGNGASGVAQSNRDCQVAPDNPNDEFTVLNFQTQNPNQQNKWDGSVTYQGPLTKNHASLFYKV
jgi:carbon monoxide dehydrogenase subunit G